MESESEEPFNMPALLGAGWKRLPFALSSLQVSHGKHMQANLPGSHTLPVQSQPNTQLKSYTKIQA